MKQPLPSTALLALLAGGLLASTASAQNPNFAPGDLVIGFQNPGGTTGANQTVLVNIGNTATVFRDASTNLIDITNIGGLLTSTFGANWWEQSSLYWTAVGVWGTNTLQSTLQNGDPNRTVYIGKARPTAGSVLTAGATPISVANNTDATTAATNANTVNTTLETQSVLAAAAIAVGSSNLDDRNPFLDLSQGLQGTAYNVFPGGVQDRFESGSHFADFAGLGSVEGALDLFRMQARNNISGQYSQGGPNFIGEYQGSIVIDQSGSISFLVQPESAPVPEPATLGFGAALLGVGAFRRFRTARRVAVA